MQKPVLGSLLDYGSPSTEGLVGAWLFNDRDGNKVFDLTGRENHGTFQNETYWKAGGVVQDGVNDYISFDWTKTGITNHPVTMMMFAWPSVRNVANTFLNATTNTADNNWLGMLFNADNNFRVLEQGNIDISLIDSGIATYGSLRQGTAVFVSSSQRINYVDGIYQSADTTATGCDISTFNTLNLGLWDRNSANTYYQCNTPDLVIYIWNRSVTASEILQLYIDPFCIIHSGYRRRMVSEEIAAGGIVQAAGQADSTTTSTAGAIRLNRPSAGTAASSTESTSGAIRLNRPGAGAAASVTSSLSGAIRLNRPGAGQAASTTTTNAGATIGILTEEELFRYRRFRLTSTYSRRLFKGVF